MPVKEHVNKLINEKSPYLLQHAHNPVEWYPWGDEAFNKAQAEDKPIFLSIGYSSCHWCHVMERECFEDEEVAELLNRSFVSIKVDREERADVDHFYMEACMALNGQGGWPLSAFLTHDRHPFFAGTYFPKYDSAYGTGFMSLLKRINEVWTTERASVEHTAASITEHFYQAETAKGAPSLETCTEAYEQFEQRFDPLYGGFGSSPKFPSVQNLLFLLRYGVLFPKSNAHAMVGQTLDCMATGGIFDPIGGGFFRYSTDRKWLVPHFEKMLYDNAMLLLVYAEASLVLDSKYKAVAQRVVEYCMREMLGSQGGFFTAEDADSEGEEGKIYLWTPKQIIDALWEPDGKAFCRDYDITPNGNFEGKNIPNRIGKNFIADDPRLKKLLTARDERVHPFKDDKVLASSNGLMIAALAAAGRMLKEHKWIVQAGYTADFIVQNLFWDDRMMSRWREGQAAHPAVLDDYAYMLWGALELYEATYQMKWLRLAEDLSDQMLELFGSGSGLLYLSGKDVHDLPLRQSTASDSALPSGNAVAALCFTRLAAITENENLRRAAEDILAAAWGELEQAPLAYAGMLCAYMTKEAGGHVSIAAGEGMSELLSALSSYNPFLTVSVCSSNYENVDESKRPLSGKATAYYCNRNGCRPPVTEPPELASLVKTMPI